MTHHSPARHATLRTVSHGLARGAWLTISIALIALVAMPTGASAQPVAVSPDLVISQVYGGGGNTGAPYKNDYVEIFNRGGAPVSLAGKSVQYASATGTGNFGANPVVVLSGSIVPGQYYLVQLAGGATGAPLPTPDATGTANMSGSAGKVALVNSPSGLACNGGSTPCTPAQLALIVDLVGYGNANFYEGAAAPTLSNTTAGFRAGNGCTDTGSNAADFSTGAPAPRNTASAFGVCSGSTPPTGTGAASPASVAPGGTTLLTVAVTPGTNPPSTGLSVTADLSAIGGAAPQTFYDDGTNGDVAAGDLVFTFSAVVGGAVAPGAKSLPATITDAQSRTGTASIALTVIGCNTTHTIAQIQGSGPSSGLAGSAVTTRGVVTGVVSNGFFVQMTTGDGDDTTSDGVFVFTSSAPPAAAARGNDVCVTGNVAEFVPSSDPYTRPLTEITGPTVTQLGTGLALPAPVTITGALLTAAGGIDQLERYEGMRVKVDSLTVVAPTDGTTSYANATSATNGVFYGTLPGVARPVREAGIQAPSPVLPCDSAGPCAIPVFDSNPERIRVDSDRQTGAAAIDATVGDTVTNLVGPLYWEFRTYSIFPDPSAAALVSAGLKARAVPVPGADDVTVGSINLERFYDTANDPPTSDDVLTPTAFANRLNKASLTIRNVLRTPDVVAVMEMENLTTLQALATEINGDAVAAGASNPLYEAYLEEGNDVGGIDVGFLVKSSRVQKVSVVQEGKDVTWNDPLGVSLLNDRPPLVLQAQVTRSTGEVFAFTVIANHLRSLNDIESNVPAGSTTTGDRVRTKRRLQAEYLADLVQDRQAANPGERILLVGDFNAFTVNDGYVDVMGTVAGTPSPGTAVVQASGDLVNPDLLDLMKAVAPPEAYSYVFDGSAQALDHAVANQAALPWVSQMAVGRSNADFPEVLRSDAARPERVSDHDGLVVYFALGSPRLTGTVVGKGAGASYVDVKVSNIGTGNARNVVIDQVLLRTLGGTGTVTLAGPGLPIAVGNVPAGGSVTVRLYFNVPGTVTRFSVTENGSMSDAGGKSIRFSLAQAVAK